MSEIATYTTIEFLIPVKHFDKNEEIHLCSVATCEIYGTEYHITDITIFEDASKTNSITKLVNFLDPTITDLANEMASEKVQEIIQDWIEKEIA